MIFATPTTVPGVELMVSGLGAATAWKARPKPNSSTECRKNAAGKVECRSTSTGVKALQQSLVELAAVTGNPQLDPGTVDGVLGQKTRLAMARALNQIGSSLPGPLSHLKLIGVPLAAASFSDKFDDQIQKAATPLAMAISVYSATRQPDPGGGGGGGGGLAPIAPAWYTTRNGKIAIGAGAGILLLLLLKK